MSAVRKIIFGAILLALSAVPALAQSLPPWPITTYGYVPTPAQWGQAFQLKQDYLGSAPCIITGCTFTGPIITAASTAIISGFNIPPGVAPTSPNNGDIWETSAGIFARVNGSTIGPLAAGSSGSFTATSPLVVTFPGGGVVNYACATCGVTGSPLSQFAATTSAQLRGIISDGTGTGALVFGTSPSLVTPSLGVATGTSLALGGATIGANALAVTGSTSLAATTVTGSFTATGLVTNADLVNSGLTLGSTALTLGATTTTVAGLTLTTPTINGATLSGTLSGAATLSGNITHSAQNIFTGTSAPASAAGNTVVMGTIAAPTLSNNGQAFLYNTAVNGAIVQGQGSTYDAALSDNAGAVALGVSTGTVNLVALGTITAASLSTSGTIGGSLCATSAGLFLYKTGVNCFGAGAATSIAPGTTTISPSTSGTVLYDNSAVVGEATVTNGLSLSAGVLGLSSAWRTEPTISTVTTTAHSGGFGANASGTYTTPANVRRIRITFVAAGGGSTGSGAGAGAAGTGGSTCWNTSGAACTSPVFASSGGGGPTTSGQVAGGASGSGTIGSTACTVFSNNGQQGSGGDTLATSGAGKAGGNSGLWPGAGAATPGGGNPGVAGTADSGGGASGASGAAVAAGAGGGGGGACITDIATPAGTYTFAVGAPGTAGTAGTSGQAGAAGGGGKIVVEEFYGST